MRPIKFPLDRQHRPVHSSLVLVLLSRYASYSKRMFELVTPSKVCGVVFDYRFRNQQAGEKKKKKNGVDPAASCLTRFEAKHWLSARIRNYARAHHGPSHSNAAKARGGRFHECLFFYFCLCRGYHFSASGFSAGPWGGCTGLVYIVCAGFALDRKSSAPGGAN